MATMTETEVEETIKVIPQKARMLVHYFPPDHKFVGMGHCPGCFLRVLAELPETK